MTVSILTEGHLLCKDGCDSSLPDDFGTVSMQLREEMGDNIGLLFRTAAKMVLGSVPGRKRRKIYGDFPLSESFGSA